MLYSRDFIATRPPSGLVPVSLAATYALWVVESRTVVIFHSPVSNAGSKHLAANFCSGFFCGHVSRGIISIALSAFIRGLASLRRCPRQRPNPGRIRASFGRRRPRHRVPARFTQKVTTSPDSHARACPAYYCPEARFYLLCFPCPSGERRLLNPLESQDRLCAQHIPVRYLVQTITRSRLAIKPAPGCLVNVIRCVAVGPCSGPANRTVGCAGCNPERCPARLYLRHSGEVTAKWHPIRHGTRDPVAVSETRPFWTP